MNDHEPEHEHEPDLIDILPRLAMRRQPCRLSYSDQHITIDLVVTANMPGMRPVVLDDKSQTSRSNRGIRYSNRCAEDILVLLEEMGMRLTQTLLADEFSRRGRSWSASCLGHTLAEMRRRGMVDNATDQWGAGYGLPAWAAQAARAEQDRGGANELAMAYRSRDDEDEDDD